MRTVYALRMALALAMVFPVLASGQERRQGGSGPPPYDKSAERTIKATAGRLYTIPAGPQREMTILTVTAEGRPLQLILGPPDFVTKQAFSVKDGEALEVTGIAGYQVNGEPAMLTRRVKAGSQTLTLRDEAGKPAWQPPSDR